MPSISPDAFRQQVARTATGPVYLIVGDDEREKSALALAAGEMIEEGLRAFNVERLYATDKGTTPQAVVDAARTLPMIAPRRVVIVIAAEKMLVPRRGRSAAEEGDDGDGDAVEVLIDYLADPAPTTTLILVCSAGDEPDAVPLPRNLRITKAIARAAAVITCSGLDGGTNPAQWVQARAKEAGLVMEHAAIVRLLEAAGGDPGRVRADVEKVLLFAAGAGTVTADHVAAVVGTATAHTDDWALVRAIEQGNAAAALRELGAALQNGAVPFQILGQIGYSIRTPPPRGRFPARRVPAAVESLLRTDVAMKSSGGDPRVLLERLIVELCG